MGGSFAVIQDTEDNIYCWGNDYSKTIKPDPNSWQVLKGPKKVLDSQDAVKSIHVGGDFAICFGEPSILPVILPETQINSGYKEKLISMDL